MKYMETAELPDELYELLDGRELITKQHEAMMLMTVTEEGWPHTAMISVGEIVALDRGQVRLAMWNGTATTRNMIRSGKATLVLVYSGKAYYVKLALRLLPVLPAAKHPRERFEADILSVRADVAAYADIRSGIQVDFKEPEAVLTRWYETLAELRL